MNCDDKVLSREEAIQFANLQERESNLQLLEWAMSLCLTGMTPAMIRLRLYNRLVEIKGEGEKA